MPQLEDGQRAKEWLIQQIVDQARVEGMMLSETERKMLYFSETHWTLPDIAEVSAKFDRENDQSDYERKITALIRNRYQQLRSKDREQLRTWSDAARVISK